MHENVSLLFQKWLKYVLYFMSEQNQQGNFADYLRNIYAVCVCVRSRYSDTRTRIIHIINICSF